MLSAVMAHFSGAMNPRLRCDFCLRLRGFGARPFVEDGEKADDVLGDLPSVLATEVALKTWLPQGNGRSIRLSFAGYDCFTEDLTVGSSPFRAPGLRLRNHTDSGGPLPYLHPRVPITGIPVKFRQTLKLRQVALRYETYNSFPPSMVMHRFFACGSQRVISSYRKIRGVTPLT